MTKYRYARSNGEFLESKFIENAQMVSDDDFTQLEAYNLTKKFVSGSTIDSSNSYPTDQELTSYTPDGLLGWWRFTSTNASSLTIKDSSNRGNTATAVSGSSSYFPAVSEAQTPGVLVQTDSMLFQRQGADATALKVTPVIQNEFSFCDDAGDKPFSVAGWFRTLHTASGTKVLISKRFGWQVAKSEWAVVLSSNDLYLYLYDAETSGAGQAFTGTNVGTWSSGLSGSTWYHFVITYDGRGGSDANDGITIYINGSNANSAGGNSIAYTSMRRTSTDVRIGLASADDNDGWEGQIGDLAIWNRVLSSQEAKQIAGVAANGAARLVRKFSQTSPENDTRLFGIETRSRGINLSGLPTDMLEGYRQGVNVNTHKQLDSFTSFKIRANSSFITTLNGVDVSRKTFDEQFATTALSSGSKAVSRVTFGGTGRLSSRISHEREHRDLGQSDVYVNYDNYEVYEDTLDLNPVGIVTTPADNLVFPRQLVVQTSNELNDGAIEPLIIRKMIDHTTIEAPFYAHDIRASLGGVEDAFRRSMVFVYGKDIDEPGQGCAPFLDATETFGTGSYGVDMPGAFSQDVGHIEPFVEYANDIDKEYTTNGVSSTIATVMILSSSFEDDDIRTYDKMAPSGFIFDNCPIGIDSVAYGGLKK